jgi:hypothetical protein
MPEEEEEEAARAGVPQTTKRPSLIMWRVQSLSAGAAEVMFSPHLHSAVLYI